MSRLDANRLVQAFAGSMKVQAPGLNDKGLGGLAFGDQSLYFELVEDSRELRCRALVHEFAREPRPRVLDAFEAEAKAGTDTGGGTVDYQPESKGLFLTRAYLGVVDNATFARDMRRLLHASRVWSEDVTDRIASKVFHVEEVAEGARDASAPDEA